MDKPGKIDGNHSVKIEEEVEVIVLVQSLRNLVEIWGDSDDGEFRVLEEWWRRWSGVEKGNEEDGNINVVKI